MVPIPFWEVLETPIHTTYKSPLETCGCGCSIAVNDWKKSNSPWVHPVATPGIHDSALQDSESGVPSARGRTANAEIASRCEGERIFFFCLPRSSNIWLWGFLFEFEAFLLMFGCFSSLSERVEKILDGSEVPKSSRWVVWVWLLWLLYLEVSGNFALKVSRLWRTSLATMATQKRCGCGLLFFSCDFHRRFWHKNQVFFGRFGAHPIHRPKVRQRREGVLGVRSEGDVQFPFLHGRWCRRYTYIIEWYREVATSYDMIKDDADDDVDSISYHVVVGHHLLLFCDMRCLRLKVLDTLVANLRKLAFTRRWMCFCLFLLARFLSMRDNCAVMLN